MMALNDVLDMLESSGLPVVYRSWPEDVPPPEMPYICFYFSSTENFAADGTAYYVLENIIVELYTEEKDPSAEAALETTIAALYWEKTETYIDSEKCYQIAYEIEV